MPDIACCIKDLLRWIEWLEAENKTWQERYQTLQQVIEQKDNAILKRDQEIAAKDAYVDMLIDGIRIKETRIQYLEALLGKPPKTPGWRS
jgi:uncharacterized protein (DUF3084 family)